MKIKKILFNLLAVMLGGCVPVMSLHPLFTEKDLVQDTRLSGVWIDDSNGVWEFKDINEPDKAYQLSLTDAEGKRGLFIVRLVKLKDKLFLDLMPERFPDGQDDAEKMKLAHKQAIYMHCLPCDRGFEVSNEVIDGPQSVVFDEAENRLHVQKAVMSLTMR